MIRRLIAAAVLAAVSFVGAAEAQNVAVIQQRQALFKQMGDASVPIGRMLRGEIPYDAAAVQAFLTSVTTVAPQLPGLFPDDSRTGGNTAALPALFTARTEVNALFQRLGTAAAAARTSITDQATLRANMPAVVGVCGECHRVYRERR